MMAAAVARIIRSGWKCERCGHEWVPKTSGVEPMTCPKCRSPYWNRPRRTAKKNTRPR